MLQRLSVFPGGWTLYAAEQVAIGPSIAEREVLDLLTSLVDKSLVLAEERAAIEPRMNQARSTLGEDVFTAAWTEGQGLTWEQVVLHENTLG